MVNLVSPAHLDNIRRFKRLFSRYQRSRDLISVGAYAAGSDLQLDQAIAIYPKFEVLLQQNLAQRADFDSSIAQLQALFAPTPDPGQTPYSPAFPPQAAIN
jgi:flagellum-specific ATP synthase